MWPVYLRDSSLSIHATIHPSTCQHSMQSSEIKAAPTSISYWLPRDTVPPAGPRSPCSLPLFGHMWNTRRHSGLVTPSDHNSSAASTLAVQQLCFLSEVSPLRCSADPIAKTFFFLIPQAKLTFHEPHSSALYMQECSVFIYDRLIL